MSSLLNNPCIWVVWQVSTTNTERELIKKNFQVIIVGYKLLILTYFTSELCSEQRKYMKGTFLVIVPPQFLLIKCSTSEICNTIFFARKCFLKLNNVQKKIK